MEQYLPWALVPMAVIVSFIVGFLVVAICKNGSDGDDG